MMNSATTTTTMEQFLNEDNNMGFHTALWNNIGGIETFTYLEVCGDFSSAVCQWASHKINDVMECKNDKFTGWTITDVEDNQINVYVPNWVMNSKPKNWKHAKNLFSRHLTVAK